jgi:hypothetical protein
MSWQKIFQKIFKISSKYSLVSQSQHIFYDFLEAGVVKRSKGGSYI